MDVSRSMDQVQCIVIHHCSTAIKTYFTYFFGVSSLLALFLFDFFFSLSFGPSSLELFLFCVSGIEQEKSHIVKFIGIHVKYYINGIKYTHIQICWYKRAADKITMKKIVCV